MILFLISMVAHESDSNQYEGFRQPISTNEFWKKSVGHIALENKSDKLGVLRRGIVEEACETTDAENADERKKEIGDVLWYVTAIAATTEHDQTQLFGGEFDSLDAAYTAASASTEQLPIFDQDHKQFDRSADSNLKPALAIDVLRLVDTLNPRENSKKAWLNVGETDRPAPQDALRSVFVAAGDYASAFHFSLDEAANMTLQKLDERERKPHVIEEPDAENIDSLRSRLTVPLAKLAFAAGADMLGEFYNDNSGRD